MNGIMNVSLFFMFFSVVYKPWVAAVAYHPVFPWRSVAPGHVGRFLRLRRPPWYATARRAHGSSHSWMLGKWWILRDFVWDFMGFYEFIMVQVVIVQVIVLQCWSLDVWSAILMKDASPWSEIGGKECISEWYSYHWVYRFFEWFRILGRVRHRLSVKHDLQPI